jgi:hypothetical protein
VVVIPIEEEDGPPIVDPDDPDFHTIGNLAGKALLLMLRDRPEKLPATFLIKLYLDYQKAAANRQIPDGGDPLVNLSVLELIDASSLPVERKKEILTTEMERLESVLADINARLEELQ